ncbi:MAG TPA: hypothetical protein VL049_12220 [Candidatus Dormibacteraeota bacterium]|nr:hypothetical protein [Candidatus Dormibacteraeota bacterium]
MIWAVSSSSGAPSRFDVHAVDEEVADRGRCPKGLVRIGADDESGAAGAVAVEADDRERIEERVEGGPAVDAVRDRQRAGGVVVVEGQHRGEDAGRIEPAIAAADEEADGVVHVIGDDQVGGGRRR